MSFPNGYFAVNMWGDRYFGPQEDTSQFIAEVTSGIIRRAEASVFVPRPESTVTRLSSFVFVPVVTADARKRAESAVIVPEVLASASSTSEASEAIEQAEAAIEVTAEVTYFTIAEVEATVKNRSN